MQSSERSEPRASCWLIMTVVCLCVCRGVGEESSLDIPWFGYSQIQVGRQAISSPRCVLLSVRH